MNPGLFCIVTAYDDRYQKMGALCEASLLRYGQAWRIPVFALRAPSFTSGRPAAWEKIRIIHDLFTYGWSARVSSVPEYVCWIDADAMLTRFDLDIRHQLHGQKDLYWVAADLTEERPDGASFQVIQPCSGFMVIRNTAWSREFLQDVWARTEFLNHCWWELAAFIQLCGYHLDYDGRMADRGKRELLALVDPKHASRSKAEILEHVGRLDPTWNCTDQSERTAAANPMVRHYTGSNGSFLARLAMMQRDAARL